MNRILLAIAPLLLLLASCASEDSATTAESGQARVLVTDAPAAEADALNVTFSEVELVGEANGRVQASVEPQTINVLSLRNGGLEVLGEVELPAGTYGQVRLIVDEAEIVFDDEGATYPVKVPSGSQTGLKINVEPELVVEADRTSDIIVDFDAQRGVVETPPGSGNYLLVPTALRAVTAPGTVEGSVVAPGEVEGVLPVGGVIVTVYDQEGNEITATVTEEDGSFKFITLVDGIYDLTFSLEGYGTVTVEDVEVTSGAAILLGEITLEFEAQVGL